MNDRPHQKSIGARFVGNARDFLAVGSTQRTSPLHIRSYLKAADHALDNAIKLGPRPRNAKRIVDLPNAPYLDTFNKKSLTNGGSNLKQL
ncbi:DUF1587 domain-containing protein, partial [bacterium]|nr:DUF1587 domain-containing protein [bacterium]